MTDQNENKQFFLPPASAPMFNLAKEIKFIAVLLILIHLLKIWFISEMVDPSFPAISAFLLYAFENMIFVPIRILHPQDGEWLAFFISPIGYSLLHGDWLHLITNLGFLVAFGAPLLKEIPFYKWLALLIISIKAGAMTFALVTDNPNIPMIGMSAGVAGLLGALLRPALLPWQDGPEPKGPFSQQKGAFMMLIFFLGINFISYLSEGGDSMLGNIAWQAHIGGMVAGFLVYPFLYKAKLYKPL